MTELSRLGKLALSHARDGFHVFPLREKSKLPATSNGFYAATTDEEQIRRWWEENPEYNIGIRTGKESGITVVDCDGPEGIAELEREATERGAIAPSEGAFLTVGTPSGGVHYYFEYTEVLGQTTELIPSVDVRNDGGYVVAPGSQVDTGAGTHTYQLEGGSITPLPFWILDLQTKRRPNLRTKSGESGSQSPHEIGEGSRNDQLTRIAGALRRQGIEATAIESTLQHVNQEVCNPPLEDEEVSRIASSVSRYEADAIESVENTRPIPAVEFLEPMVRFLRDPNKVKGLSTGIDDMDKLLGGGYRDGEVIAINAPGKTGKSTFVRKLVHSLVDRGEPTGYASREEYADREVLPQLLSIATGKSVLKSEIDEAEYQQILERWPLYFAPGYGKFPQFARWLENCKEAGCKVVFVDHLHFMTKDEDYQEAVRVMHEAVKMAKTLDLCIVMIIQPKGLQPGQELGLETLRGGAAIGQAITMLLTLERLKDHANVSKIRLVAKRSPLAKLGEFFLQLDEESLDMVEMEFEKEEETVVEWPNGSKAHFSQHPPKDPLKGSGVDLFKRSEEYWGSKRNGAIPPPLSE